MEYFGIKKPEDQLLDILLAGIGAKAKDIKDVVIRNYNKVERMLGMDYWPVKASGFGFDTQESLKRTIDLEITCHLEEMANRCVEIWKRIASEKWKDLDFRLLDFADLFLVPTKT